MEMIGTLLNALFQQDLKVLSQPSLKFIIYIILFTIIFLENGILPAAFLPGDTVLILVGILIAKNVLSFIFSFVLLIIASSMGYWLSYIQGKYLKNFSITRSFLLKVPNYYRKKTNNLFNKYGLYALIIGRFISFIRTLLPTLIGLYNINKISFQIFNWISAFIWVSILTMLGYIIGITKIFQAYEKIIILFCILLPLIIIIMSLIWLFIIYIKKILLK